MDFTSFDDYRDILKHQYNIKKQTNRRITLDYLAEKSLIQKSYISRVFNKHIHLNHEQLFKVASLLTLPEHVKDYCLTLIEYQKNSDHELKIYLKKKMDFIRQQHSGAKDSVKSKLCVERDSSDYQDYYINTIIPIIHMHLCIPKYSANFKLLTKKLNLNEAELAEAIEVLQKLKLIEVTKNKIIVLEETLHIPQNNSLSKVHQMNQRIMAQRSLQESHQKDNTFFSASFTASKESIDKIKYKYHKFLEEIKETLEDQADNEDDVYHLNIDLFT